MYSDSPNCGGMGSNHTRAIMQVSDTVKQLHVPMGKQLLSILISDWDLNGN